MIVAGTALFGAEKPDEVIKGFKSAIADSKQYWGTDKALEV